MVTAVIGFVTGANRAFSLTLFALLSTWPLSVYWSARLFRLGRWTAAAAALCAPFVVSNMGIGYEEVSYTFVGFGLWSQLWGMWALPLAWATSWRTVSGDRRFFPAATVLIAATVAFHFMTGYLALMVVPLWVVVGGRDVLRRAVRGTWLLAASFLCAAWAIVPLLVFRPWASVNEALAGGPDARSYGAGTALSWLLGGRLLDNGRWPVLTALAAFGLASSIWRSRTEEAPRALLAAGLLSLLLFFGRPTWGSLMNLLPGSTDLFLRRFVMGVQLAGILFAGIGLAALGQLGWRGAGALAAWGRRRATAARPPALAFTALALFVGVVGLSPAWRQVQTGDDTNAGYISAQQTADARQGGQLAALIEDVKRLGGGRVYAGTPTNWGISFTIGAVPVFRYLAYLDVDEVGFTLRTASLMTGPETDFDESNPGDYLAFGVRFLVLPTGHKPPVPARLVARRGSFALWTVGRSRYISVVQTVAPAVVATRSDLAAATQAFLLSQLPALGLYPTVAFDGGKAAAPTLSAPSAGGAPQTALPAGSVTAEADHPAAGQFSASVLLKRRAVVLLKASYDPGWHVTVDGRSAPVEMVAPALVGVVVGPGRHQVDFTYVGYSRYWLLFALAGLGLALAVAGAFAGLRAGGTISSGWGSQPPPAVPGPVDNLPSGATDSAAQPGERRPSGQP
jgi:hypothetical protein